MRKPWVTLVIEQELLDKLEKNRLKEIQEQKKVISRSAYISDLITKGLSLIKK